MSRAPEFRYTPAQDAEDACFQLILATGDWERRRFPFGNQIEIGRLHGERPAAPGQLLFADRLVSRRHCVISCRADGRCGIRDLSRNGTWVDGARILPNQERVIETGQVIMFGDGLELRLEGERDAGGGQTEIPATATDVGARRVTVLVGDIRDYTRFVQGAPGDALLASVHRVFAALEREVRRQGGSVKEHPGDAIVAFWEQRSSPVTAVAACLAAVELDRLVRSMAGDLAVWNVPGFPLQMDWALATGEVVIDSYGEDGPVGLSMVGEAPVLAFRLEKACSDETGAILVCEETARHAGLVFQFKDLGLLELKGFEGGRRAFALVPPDEWSEDDLDRTLEGI